MFSGRRLICRFVRLLRNAKLLFQFLDLSQQFRQLLKCEQLALHLPIGCSRRSPPFFAVFDIVHDAGLSGDCDAVTDLYMSGQSDLSSDYHVVAQLRAAGNPGLSHHEAMLPD